MRTDQRKEDIIKYLEGFIDNFCKDNRTTYLELLELEISNIDPSDRVSVLDHMLTKSAMIDGLAADSLKQATSKIATVCSLLASLHQQYTSEIIFSSDDKTLYEKTKNQLNQRMQEHLYYTKPLSVRGFLRQVDLRNNSNQRNLFALAFCICPLIIVPAALVYGADDIVLQGVEKMLPTYEEKCNLFAEVFSQYILSNSCNILGHHDLASRGVQSHLLYDFLGYYSLFSGDLFSETYKSECHRYTIHPLDSMPNNQQFNCREETADQADKATHKLYVGLKHDQLCYQTYDSTGEQQITTDQAEVVIGVKQTKTLFDELKKITVELTEDKKLSLLKPLLGNLRKLTVLRGHTYDAHNLRSEDIPAIFEAIWDAVANTTDMAVRLRCLKDMDTSKTENSFTAKMRYIFQCYLNSKDKYCAFAELEQKRYENYVGEATYYCVEKYLSEHQDNISTHVGKVIRNSQKKKSSHRMLGRGTFSVPTGYYEISEPVEKGTCPIQVGERWAISVPPDEDKGMESMLVGGQETFSVPPLITRISDMSL